MVPSQSGESCQILEYQVWLKPFGHTWDWTRDPGTNRPAHRSRMPHHHTKSVPLKNGSPSMQGSQHHPFAHAMNHHPQPTERHNINGIPIRKLEVTHLDYLTDNLKQVCSKKYQWISEGIVWIVSGVFTLIKENTWWWHEDHKTDQLSWQVVTLQLKS